MKFNKLWNWLCTGMIILFNVSGTLSDRMIVSDLQCENLYDPLAVNTIHPRFSWKNSSDRQGASQTAYQIVVATEPDRLSEKKADRWDSGKISSSESILIKYAGDKLETGQLLYWKIRVWDEDDRVSDWSKPAKFGIGLLQPTDWSASFIGCPEETDRQNDNGFQVCPQFKKAFRVEKMNKGETFLLHINSLGYHEVYVNGLKVGNQVLAPAVSQFNKRSLINTYDVTDFIEKGPNNLIIWLGSGWYTEGLPGVAGNGPVCKAQLEKVFRGSSNIVCVTDESWTTRKSEYERIDNWRSNHYGGETVTGNLETRNQVLKAPDEFQWRTASIVEIPPHAVSSQMVEPNRIKETINPILIDKLNDSTLLIDMGKTITGWFEITFPSLKKGQEIVMRYADHLKDDGTIADQGQIDRYIASGHGTELFINKFNYHGFRYVKISNLRQKPLINKVKAHFIHTNFKTTSTFVSSDDDLNRIHDMISYTLRNVAIGGYLVDCPQLERLGYGGDGNASTVTAQTMFNLAPLYANWLQAWGDVIREDGGMPHTAPNPYKAGGGPYWCGFLISASWNSYQQYGDIRLLEQYYPVMQQWLGYVEKHSVEGLLKKWPDTDYRNWYLGDWATPEGVGDPNHEDERSVDLVSNCYISVCLGQMADIAAVLGKQEDQKKYTELRTQLNNKIHHIFYNEAKGYYATGSQIDMIFPMLAGVTPVPLRHDLTKRLIEKTEKEFDGHLNTGLVGIPVMMEWAATANQPDFIYSMLKKETYPGYLHMLKNGATTTWEHWNGDRSRIHNCYNGVGQWFYQVVGGIRTIKGEPAYRKFIIQPQIPDGVTWARTSQDTPYGKIEVNWELHDGKMKMDVSVPVGSTAILQNPVGTKEMVINGEVMSATIHQKELKSGKYDVEFLISSGSLQEQLNSLEQLKEETFKKPEIVCYPETWFHFIGGNVSKEGITADLEAISQAGFSGIHLFHGQFGGEWPGVTLQIKALSESWNELILWTAKECKRLGLRYYMQNCPGWSYAGGPWIEPENSMRHLTYSRTDILGGQAVRLRLEKPKNTNDEWRNYKDLFVIAFPTPKGDTGERFIPENVTSNLKGSAIRDCLISQKKVLLPPSPSAPTTIDVRFSKKVTIRTVEFPPVESFSHAWCYSPDVTVSVYAITPDNKEVIARINMPPGSWQDDRSVTIACKEATTDNYQIEISNLHEMALSYINFYTAARQQNWESEAAWTLRRIMREDYPDQSKESWVDPSKIVNITGHTDPSGLLTWKVPEGDWTVLRIGDVNTGMKNGPAPPEATGWESTKLSTSGIRANFDGYIGRLINGDGVLKDNMLDGILLDSWECKTQTWTGGLDKIFQDKWGYSIFSIFPALFGYVVDNPESTSLFLRDWRVTLNDLLVKNFFGEMNHLAKKNDLRLSFETASGDIFPGDILEYYKYADIPMCEYWHPRSESFVGSLEFKPVKPAVSAAHMYGKKRVAAEAFTSFDLTWNEHPAYLKDIADIHYAEGVTHPVFHTYTHNPRTDFLPPGSSFGAKIGTPFLRLQTWWQHMPLFTDYLARCTYMLECGRPISDVLMYLGDEQNHKPDQLLDFPDGFRYDYCNPDVLLNRLSVKDGLLITPEGITYRVLWLHDCKRMVPETLEKILSLVKDGAIVTGAPPLNIATLSGGESSKARFQELVQELWGDGSQRVRSIGKGKVYIADIEHVLISENITHDIEVESHDLRWYHRQTYDADLYFISMPPEKGFQGNIKFRSNKKYAEIWDPITGNIREIKQGIKTKKETNLSMNISAGSSLFVVFKNSSSERKSEYFCKTEKREITQPWLINFPKGWGVDTMSIKMDKLTSWKNMPFSDEGVSFSGTASYSNNIHLREKQSGMQYMLDLGRVEMIAKVYLNGEYVDTKWCYPYQVDISRHIKEGSNHLEVEVTSTWFNRLSYDASLPENERKTWTISAPAAGSTFKEYGLLGPVYIYSAHESSPKND